MKVYFINPVTNDEIELVRAHNKEIKEYPHRYFKTFTKAKQELIKRLNIKVSIMQQRIDETIWLLVKLHKLKKKEIK